MKIPLRYFADSVTYEVSGTFFVMYRREILRACSLSLAPVTEEIRTQLAYKLRELINAGDVYCRINFHTSAHRWLAEKFPSLHETPPRPTIDQLIKAVQKMDWGAYIDRQFSTPPNAALSLTLRLVN